MSLPPFSSPISQDQQQPLTFRFITTQSYTKHLKCPICLQLMIKPMRFHPCGHTFCYNCIQNQLNINPENINKIQTISTNSGKKKRKSNKKVNKNIFDPLSYNYDKCPYENCQQTWKNIQNDRTAEGLIDQLKVQCINSGCVWKGSYDNYKKIHKDKCILKNGLDQWLKKLKDNVKITKTSTYDYQQEEKQQQYSHNKNISEELDYQSYEENSKSQQIFTSRKKQSKYEHNQKSKIQQNIYYQNYPKSQQKTIKSTIHNEQQQNQYDNKLNYQLKKSIQKQNPFLNLLKNNIIPTNLLSHTQNQRQYSNIYLKKQIKNTKKKSNSQKHQQYEDSKQQNNQKNSQI